MRTNVMLLSAFFGLAGPLAGTAVAVNIETVPVGNPGNAGELSGAGAGGYGPDQICGAVDYEYRIGKYEVTAGQYTEFLNAVAKTDTYRLYTTEMIYSAGCKIDRTGSSGSYTYSVASDYADRPVNWVSWGDAARFANWMHNGQPTGTQNASTTEDGSYALNGAMTNATLMPVTRKADATWVIPTEDEWYKAAYYKGGSANAGYWDYPTSNDTLPGRDLADASGNNANYYGSPYPIDSGKYATLVGEFQYSDSPYGTFDQGGNVSEWNEAVPASGYRGLRGGSFFSPYGYDLLASYRNFNTASLEHYSFGFRVVLVPEPSALLLLALGGVAVIRRRVRRLGVPVIAALLGVSLLSATPARAVNIETMPIGDVGNAGDTRYPVGTISSFGSVGYSYNIGKYEVTAGQYCEFLNAVAREETYGLYNTYMSDTSWGSGISRSGGGTLGNPYTYAVASDFINRPVNFVSWGDAARFANWLHNGQPTGAQNASTTEDGAYDLSGTHAYYDAQGGAANWYALNTALTTVMRKPNATWGIPTEDEWYKAAYYKGGSTNAGYFDYPTSSDTVPGRDMADASGNNANFYIDGSPPIDPDKRTTVVGEFQNSDSPYGTFDQGGNVREWTEAVWFDEGRGQRG
ncbi:MAG: formylglycine-generating enzyme family protein, partial [Planctomycetes bacterium]|nr:formylglycine-generating enzyme family protein [Planctomycetota bacterium]